MTKRLVIVGCGPSSLDYLPMADAFGDKSRRYDEVWTINSMASVLQCDRIFHMDDLRVQELRARADPDGKIGPMIDYFKRTSIPVYTSRAYPEYPTTIDFPLNDVVSKLGTFYFTSTPAYAIALAIYEGWEEINLFGMDYTWPNSEQAEEGRGCAEFWLGQAMARGIVLCLGSSSTLLSMRKEPQDRLYGYDSQRLTQIVAENGKIRFDWEDKELPSADEMEKRYDKLKPLDSAMVNGSGG